MNRDLLWVHGLAIVVTVLVAIVPQWFKSVLINDQLFDIHYSVVFAFGYGYSQNNQSVVRLTSIFKQQDGDLSITGLEEFLIISIGIQYALIVVIYCGLLLKTLCNKVSHRVLLITSR